MSSKVIHSSLQTLAERQAIILARRVFPIYLQLGKLLSNTTFLCTRFMIY